jgi:hypothetical protein
MCCSLQIRTSAAFYPTTRSCSMHPAMRCKRKWSRQPRELLTRPWRHCDEVSRACRAMLCTSQLGLADRALPAPRPRPHPVLLLPLHTTPSNPSCLLRSLPRFLWSSMPQDPRKALPVGSAPRRAQWCYPPNPPFGRGQRQLGPMRLSECLPPTKTRGHIPALVMARLLPLLPAVQRC